MSYLYDPNDGKIHTRFSELIRCTPGSVDRVIADRASGRELRLEATDFGRVRHELWAEESLRTGMLPACFERPGDAKSIEKEFVAEILPGVVVHCRIDALSDAQRTIVDYKTARMPNGADLAAYARKMCEKYRKSKQLRFYGYLLGLNGFRINNSAFLIEVWDEPRENILGYYSVEVPLDLSIIASVIPWAEDRIACLAAAYDKVEQ